MKTMKSDQAPAPNWYPVEWYKTFSSELVSLMVQIARDTHDSVILPKSMLKHFLQFCQNQENIYFSFTCNFFHNADDKTLTTALAVCLKFVLLMLLHPSL